RQRLRRRRMIFSRKRGARRREIRKNRPDIRGRWLQDMRADGSLTAFWVALFFWLGTVAVMSLRPNVISYRPGQFASHDIVSRVRFTYHDKDELENVKRVEGEMEPRVYVAADAEQWNKLEETLLALPKQLVDVKEEELPTSLRPIFDGGALNKLQEYATPDRIGAYQDSVRGYVSAIRKFDPIIIPADQRAKDLGRRIAVARHAV